MPRCPGNGTVIIESGDNLWVASEFVLKYEGNKNPTRAQIQKKSNEIVALNNITNPHLIYAGQVFKVHPSTAPTTSGSKSNAPVITHMGIQNGTERTVYVTWTWNEDKLSTTEKYEYEWYYDTGDGHHLEWYYGGGQDSGKRQHVTFSAPDNAKRVMFKVRPIAVAKKEA